MSFIIIMAIMEYPLKNKLQQNHSHFKKCPDPLLLNPDLLNLGSNPSVW